MPDETLIYHFTHRQNLARILETGALQCVTSLMAGEVQTVSVAHQGIQERRAVKRVTCPPHGVVHDYVPFYFATRQPMLYAIYRQNVATFHGRQEDLIYLVSSVERVQASGQAYLFTDGHPTMAFTQFYADWAQAQDVIDWPLMAETYWADTDEDNDRKRRRQAEFLVHQQLPCTAILGIATMNADVEQWVNEQLSETLYNEWYVAMRRDWYF